MNSRAESLLSILSITVLCALILHSHTHKKLRNNSLNWKGRSPGH